MEGVDNYKITGKDFKEQTGGGGVLIVTAQISPVDAYEGAVVTCTATADDLGTPPMGLIIRTGNSKLQAVMIGLRLLHLRVITSL